MSFKDVLSSVKEDFFSDSNKDLKRKPFKGPLVICYGDSFKKGGLKKVKSFLDKTNFENVHILPFHPTDGDFGFSVQDYKNVRKELGSFEDIKKISENYVVVSDLVLNHCSFDNKQFGEEFFLSYDKEPKHNSVFRPRIHNLFTKKNNKYYWTTFSDKQFDIDFSKKEVYNKFKEIIDNYFNFGVSVLRLDAVGYVFKDPNKSSFCEPESYDVCGLFSDYVNFNKKGYTIAEINAPSIFNMSFLKCSNFVYNFDLTSSLCYSFFYEDSKKLYKVQYSDRFINPVSTHDGIPMLSLLDDKYNFSNDLKEKGFEVSYKDFKTPYELNSSLFSLFGKEGVRAICAICFFVPGIPSIFINDFFLKENIEGKRREIHRGKLDEIADFDPVLNSLLKDCKNLKGSLNLIEDKKELFVAKRGNVLCVVNLSKKEVDFKVEGYDLISKKEVKKKKLKSYEFYWISS